MRRIAVPPPAVSGTRPVIIGLAAIIGLAVAPAAAGPADHTAPADVGPADRAAGTIVRPAASLHLVPADGEPCMIDDAELRCAELNHRGTPGIRQYAYIVVSGFEGMSGFQFGIDYDPTVQVGGWSPCLTGVEVPTGNWPARRSGMGIGWSRCVPPIGPDSLIVIGSIEILEGSWGRIWIEPYSYEADARIETCSRPVEQISVDPAAMGMARVDGSGPGRPGCRRTRPRIRSDRRRPAG